MRRRKPRRKNNYF